MSHIAYELVDTRIPPTIDGKDNTVGGVLPRTGDVVSLVVWRDDKLEIVERRRVTLVEFPVTMFPENKTNTRDGWLGERMPKVYLGEKI